MKTPIWKLLNLPKPRVRATLPKPGAKRRKSPVQWEEQFQRSVADFFAWALPPDVLWFAVPNGGWRNKAVAAKLKAGGVRPGVSDFVLVYEGRAYFLELKAKGGQQSEAQIVFEADACRAGAEYRLAADTIEDVRRAIRRWGIPIKIEGGLANHRDGP